MCDQLLSAFNSYAFTNTTQILLSNLTDLELREILAALQGKNDYSHLAHMVRVTLFLNISHRVDRTLYLAHYALVQVQEFTTERRSTVAGNVQSEQILETLQVYNLIKEKASLLFEDDAEAVLTAAFDPELALPPARRSTVAPGCETVFQIALACETIKRKADPHFEEEPSDQLLTKRQCFYELLAFQTKIADLEISAINDPFEHFSELVLRFMVFRNSVLSMHEIIPFSSLCETMKLWSSAMEKHYEKANHTFAEVAGLKFDPASVYGRFTPDLLIEEGYLNEYVEALVDLSIDENLVAFCAHSKQHFGQLYESFEKLIIDQFKSETYKNCGEQLNKWCNYGLKPCTLLKIIESSVSCSDEELKYDYCLRKDDYILNCARIHGFIDHSTALIACQ